MTGDLAAFLGSRLDEDEAAARAATAGPWALAWNGQQLELRAADAPWPITEWTFAVQTGAPHADTEQATCDIGDADHIARHNPARALADIAAKRGILAAHTPVQFETVDPDRDTRTGEMCPSCLAEDPPCPTLRHLAAPYAEHPDYDPAWRP